jgi:hypothetical protein
MVTAGGLELHAVHPSCQALRLDSTVPLHGVQWYTYSPETHMVVLGFGSSGAKLQVGVYAAPALPAARGAAAAGCADPEIDPLESIPLTASLLAPCHHPVCPLPALSACPACRHIPLPPCACRPSSSARRAL